MSFPTSISRQNCSANHHSNNNNFPDRIRLDSRVNSFISGESFSVNYPLPFLSENQNSYKRFSPSLEFQSVHRQVESAREAQDSDEFSNLLGLGLLAMFPVVLGFASLMGCSQESPTPIPTNPSPEVERSEPPIPSEESRSRILVELNRNEISGANNWEVIQVGQAHRFIDDTQALRQEVVAYQLAIWAWLEREGISIVLQEGPTKYDENTEGPEDFRRVFPQGIPDSLTPHQSRILYDRGAGTIYALLNHPRVRIFYTVTDEELNQFRSIQNAHPSNSGGGMSQNARHLLWETFAISKLREIQNGNLGPSPIALIFGIGHEFRRSIPLFLLPSEVPNLRSVCWQVPDEWELSRSINPRCSLERGYLSSQH